MHILHKVIEAAYFAKMPRYAFNGWQRMFNLREREVIKKYISNNVIAGKNILVALNCRDPYQFEHIREIYFYLKKHRFFLPFPFGSLDRFNKDNKSNLSSYFEKEYNLFYGVNYFSYNWLSLLKPRVLLEPTITTYTDFCKKSMKILYAHGLSSLGFSKNFSHIRYTRKYDYIFLTGPLQKKALIYANKKHGGVLPKMIEVGFLRGDRLAERQKIFDNANFLHNLGLASNFTVLFAPTWGEFSATREWIDRVVQLCKSLNINLLIKLHPLMLRGRTKWETGGVDWISKLNKISEDYVQARIISEENIDDYMLASDVLITDASSVGIEFMVLNKPVIFLPCPHYFKIYGEQRPIKWIRNGFEITHLTELKSRLINIMEGQRCNCLGNINEVVFNPGKAMNVISGFLEASFHENITG